MALPCLWFNYWLQTVMTGVNSVACQQFDHKLAQSWVEQQDICPALLTRRDALIWHKPHHHFYTFPINWFDYMWVKNWLALKTTKHLHTRKFIYFECPFALKLVFNLINVIFNAKILPRVPHDLIPKCSYSIFAVYNLTALLFDCILLPRIKFFNSSCLHFCNSFNCQV